MRTNKMILLSLVILLNAGRTIQAQDKKIDGLIGLAATSYISDGTNWSGFRGMLGLGGNKNTVILEITSISPKKKEQTGSYDYNYSCSFKTMGNIIFVDGSGHTIINDVTIFETQNNGKITTEYEFLEFMLSWNRLFDLSKNWLFRIGPGVGLMRFDMKDKFSPSKYKKHEIRGIPQGIFNKHKSVLKAGVTAGIRWRALELNYCIFTTKPVIFPERNITMATIAENETQVFNHRVDSFEKTLEGKNFGGRIGHQVTIAFVVDLRKESSL